MKEDCKPKRMFLNETEGIGETGLNKHEFNVLSYTEAFNPFRKSVATELCVQF